MNLHLIFNSIKYLKIRHEYVILNAIMVEKKVYRCTAITKKYRRCKNKLMYSKNFKKYCYCHKRKQKICLPEKDDNEVIEQEDKNKEVESCHLLILFNIYMYLAAVFMFYIIK